MKPLILFKHISSFLFKLIIILLLFISPGVDVFTQAIGHFWSGFIGIFTGIILMINSYMAYLLEAMDQD